jgi:hypothetical protein
MIQEQLVHKAWTACGYQTEEQLCSKTLGQMVVWDENAIMKNLAEICGDDTHYRSEENDDEMGFFDFLGGENDAEAEEESELVNVSELSGGEQKVSGPKIRKYGQGHFLGCRRLLNFTFVPPVCLCRFGFVITTLSLLESHFLPVHTLNHSSLNRGG